jgi:hypothetical protein
MFPTLKSFLKRSTVLTPKARTLGVRNWKEIVSDRIRWRGIVKVVLA